MHTLKYYHPITHHIQATALTQQVTYYHTHPHAYRNLATLAFSEAHYGHQFAVCLRALHTTVTCHLLNGFCCWVKKEHQGKKAITNKRVIYEINLSRSQCPSLRMRDVRQTQTTHLMQKKNSLGVKQRLGERRKRPVRNQLLKLNIKNTGIIVCGKAICLQLGGSHISQSAEKGNRTLMEWQRPLRHFKIQPRPDV